MWMIMKDDVDDDEGWGGWWWRRDLIAMKTNPLLDPSCSHTFGSGTSAMPKVFFSVFVVFLVLHTVYNSWWICIFIVLNMAMVRVFLIYIVACFVLYIVMPGVLPWAVKTCPGGSSLIVIHTNPSVYALKIVLNDLSKMTLKHSFKNF